MNSLSTIAATHDNVPKHSLIPFNVTGFRISQTQQFPRDLLIALQYLGSFSREKNFIIFLLF